LTKGVLMNKYEKLIEYIINENEQKARELFHEIVVEKSRDIYESLMDEEQVEENFGNADPAGQMINDVENQTDETAGLGEDDDEGEEFSLGDEPGAEGGDELGGELGGDDLGDELGGDDLGGDEGGIRAELEAISDKIDQLLADVGGSDLDSDEDMGAGDEEAFGGSDDEAPAEVGASDDGASDEEETPFAEGKQPPWLKGSGASGSGKSGSGKSGSGKSGSGKGSGSGVAESKSVAQLMREYVDTIGQVYGGEGDNAEGTESGNGKKVPVNTKSISRTSGPDFGGTSKNILNKTGATEESPDGKQTPKPNNEYSKGEGKFSKEKFQNVAGGTKKQSAVGKNWEKENGAEGQTTSGKVTVASKSVQTQNTGK
jgi:hypothetical protein